MLRTKLLFASFFLPFALSLEVPTLFDSGLVDTYGEGQKIADSVDSFGDLSATLYTTRSGWIDSLAGAKVALVPQLRSYSRSTAYYPSLTEEQRTSIFEFVENGGTLVSAVDYYRRNHYLLNDVFGWSLARYYTSSTHERQDGASGTCFDAAFGSPAELERPSYVMYTTNLPDGATTYYGNTYTSVWSVKVGNGTVYMIGYDWRSGAVETWDWLLETALTCPDNITVPYIPTTTPPPVDVATLFDSKFVDVSHEAKNLVASVEDGTALSQTSAESVSDWIEALASASAALLPELKAYYSSYLTTAQKTAIVDFVNNGGTLVSATDSWERNHDLLNDVFGWSISRYSSGSSTRQDAAAGTCFDTKFGSPSSLSNAYTSTFSRVRDLPEGATVLYGYGDGSTYASVWSVEVGAGKVYMLAYDWSAGRVSDWEWVLEAALSCKPTTTSSTTTTVAETTSSKTTSAIETTSSTAKDTTSSSTTTSVLQSQAATSSSTTTPAPTSTSSESSSGLQSTSSTVDSETSSSTPEVSRTSSSSSPVSTSSGTTSGVLEQSTSRALSITNASATETSASFSTSASVGTTSAFETTAPFSTSSASAGTTTTPPPAFDVATLFDPDMVDTRHEAANILNSVEEGTELLQFTADSLAEWVERLDSVPAALLPEIKSYNPYAGTVLTSDQKSAVFDFVNNGGTLVSATDSWERNHDLLNDVFQGLGWSVSRYYTSGNHVRQDAAAGTCFDTKFGSPSSLSHLTSTTYSRVRDLPEGATVLYGYGDGSTYASVWSVEVGAGKVYMLAYDWSAGRDADWEWVLAAALGCAASTTTTSSTTTAAATTSEAETTTTTAARLETSAAAPPTTAVAANATANSTVGIETSAPFFTSPVPASSFKIRISTVLSGISESEFRAGEEAFVEDVAELASTTASHVTVLSVTEQTPLRRSAAGNAGILKQKLRLQQGARRLLSGSFEVDVESSVGGYASEADATAAGAALEAAEAELLSRLQEEFSGLQSVAVTAGAVEEEVAVAPALVAGREEAAARTEGTASLSGATTFAVGAAVGVLALAALGVGVWARRRRAGQLAATRQFEARSKHFPPTRMALDSPLGDPALPKAEAQSALGLQAVGAGSSGSFLESVLVVSGDTGGAPREHGPGAAVQVGSERSESLPAPPAAAAARADLENTLLDLWDGKAGAMPLDAPASGCVDLGSLLHPVAADGVEACLVHASPPASSGPALV